MSSFEKAVILLGQTDGRDKIYKSLLGLFRAVAAVAAQQSDPHAKGYTDVVSCIRTARSLMRMGKFVADFTKLRALMSIFKAQGIRHTENKKLIEFARVICNAMYVLFDNIAFLCHFNVLSIRSVIDGTRCALLSQRAQLCGYALSLVFNLYELRDGLLRLEYDPPAAKRASIKASVAASRDVVDVVVTASDLATVSGGSLPASLPDVSLGALMFLSGALSTYLNWQKIK